MKVFYIFMHFLTTKENFHSSNFAILCLVYSPIFLFYLLFGSYFMLYTFFRQLLQQFLNSLHSLSFEENILTSTKIPAKYEENVWKCAKSILNLQYYDSVNYQLITSIDIINIILKSIAT